MNGTPYYTNSSHLPVGYTEDIFSALDIQDDLQTLYTSGTVFHAFLGEKLPDWKAAANLVRKIAENYKLPYYTMSPTYSVCRDHGYLTGEQFICPICGRKTEVYSRITGYYRPVQNWNDGKAQEYKDRRVYNIGHSLLRHKGPNPAPTDEKVMQAAPVAAGSVRTSQKRSAAENKTAAKPVNVVMSTIPNVDAGTENHASDPSILLFKTTTCPNCKAATAMLDSAGVPYTLVDAAEHRDLVDKYSIMTAPTLVLVNGDSFERFRGVSDIKGWLKRR